MKKYIVFIVILFFACFFLGCSKQTPKLNDLEKIKERGYLIVGVKTDSPPFGYYDKKNHLAGIDIELAKAVSQGIFDESNPANIKFVPVDTQNRIAKLNSREVDILIATMSVNDKRKLVLDFSNPYFSASQKIMVKKGSGISHIHYFNSKGRIAVVLGSTGERILRLISPNARVIGAHSYSEALNLLSSGKVQAILGDDCILAGLNNGRYKIINKAYSKEFYAVALRKTEDSRELMAVVNSSIASFVDKKNIDIIRKRYKGK